MPIFKLVTKDRTQRYTISANNVLELKQKAVIKLLLQEDPELTIVSMMLYNNFIKKYIYIYKCAL